MKKNINKESPIETISVKNDFEWFGYEWDIYENFDSSESLIENVDIQKLDTTKIDKLVESEDYMWLQDYLDNIEEDQKLEANEYIQSNFPEFLQDEEWNTFEPMKWNTLKDKELIENLDKKPHFNRNKIKDELWDALVESYKNAA
jgi:hypothetical protein